MMMMPPGRYEDPEDDSMDDSDIAGWNEGLDKEHRLVRSERASGGSETRRMKRIDERQNRSSPYARTAEISRRQSRPLPAVKAGRMDKMFSNEERLLQKAKVTIAPRSMPIYNLVEEAVKNPSNFGRYSKACEISLADELSKLSVSEVSSPPILGAIVYTVVQQNKLDSHMNGTCKSCLREAEKTADIYAIDVAHCELVFKQQWFHIPPEVLVQGLRRCHLVMVYQSTKPATMRGRNVIYIPFDKRLTHICEAAIKLVVPCGSDWSLRNTESGADVHLFPKAVLESMTEIIGDLIAFRSDGTPVELQASGLSAVIRKKLVDALARTRRHGKTSDAALPAATAPANDKGRLLKSYTSEEYKIVLDKFNIACSSQLSTSSS